MHEVNIFRGALGDLRSGNTISPYPIDQVLDFFDAVEDLTTVFLLIDPGWKETIDGERSNGLLAALLCFLHVMAYWLNIHHMLKYSPMQMSVLQVWCVAFFSLGMVFYLLCIIAWIEEGSVEGYYIINLALYSYSFGVIFSFLTQIERVRSNVLYKLWHKMAPIMSLIWYSIAYILLKIGREQRWMIIVALFSIRTTFSFVFDS